VSDAVTLEQVFCARCGEPRSEGSHVACERALDLEPPRYCPACKRRMVVQVHPLGYTARCSEHGDITELG
jgi:hypothetical protein